MSQKQKSKTEEATGIEQVSTKTKKKESTEEVKAKTEEILDEIDEILEEYEEDFAQKYVQRGGE